MGASPSGDARPCRPFAGGTVPRASIPLLVLWLALSGCSAAPRTGPVTSLVEARQAGLVMQRYDLSCGAAAIATLLTYQHGDAVAETAVAHAMLRATDPAKVKARGGFSLLEMKRYVESRGYRGAGYRELTFEQLERLGPAIVTIDAGGGQYKHFVVFNGTLADRVRLADPAFGHRTMTRTAFERAWVGRLAFVVRSPDTPMRRLAQGPRQLPIPSDSLIRQAMP